MYRIVIYNPSGPEAEGVIFSDGEVVTKSLTKRGDFKVFPDERAARAEWAGRKWVSERYSGGA